MSKLSVNIPEFTTNLRPYNLASCEVAAMLLYFYEIVQNSFYNNMLVTLLIYTGFFKKMLFMMPRSFYGPFLSELSVNIPEFTIN